MQHYLCDPVSQEGKMSQLSKDDAILLDNQLCFRLYQASRLMIQAYQPCLVPLGLTYLQYLVLMVLWESDRLSVSAIGKSMRSSWLAANIS